MNSASKFKWVVFVATSAVIFVLGWSFAKEGLEKHKEMLASREQALKEFKSLCIEYAKMREIENSLNRVIEKRPHDFSLSNFAMSKASELGIKGNVKSIAQEKPVEVGNREGQRVRLQLERVTLGQLVDFMNKIEQPEEYIRVIEASVRPNRDRVGYLDAELLLSTLVKKQ